MFHLAGSLTMILGIILLLPLTLAYFFHERHLILAFFLSSLISVSAGYAMKRFTRSGAITTIQSMLICGVAWILLSLFACLPFYFGTGATLLDSYFETVSGFTTTGITLFTDIESLPKSLLFWRSLIQWLGGLGILTFFLAITFGADSSNFQLFSAESHKIDSTRLTPSITRTVIILWGVYILLTVSEVLTLKLLDVSLYDAVCHSLTTLSTGGFSTYDVSIDHFRRAGFEHYRAIEYAVAFFMFLGGVNFLLHFKILSGRFRDVAGNTELRWFVTIILCATALVMLEHYRHFRV